MGAGQNGRTGMFVLNLVDPDFKPGIVLATILLPHTVDFSALEYLVRMMTLVNSRPKASRHFSSLVFPISKKLAYHNAFFSENNTLNIILMKICIIS
jgi:hypothetical protein